jgi:hypothetical protein
MEKEDVGKNFNDEVLDCLKAIELGVFLIVVI